MDQVSERSQLERRKKYFPIWAAALRSGKYKQGQTSLRPEEDRFCCLGVLCDLGESKAWSPSGVGYYFKGVWGSLPTEVYDEVGLYPHEEADLVSANDNGYSFAQIADYLESAAGLNPAQATELRWETLFD